MGLMSEVVVDPEIVWYDLPKEISEVMMCKRETLPKIKVGDFVLELELNDLSDEMKEVARKELRETPEVKKEAIAKLRELLQGEKDLKTPWDFDHWLVRFLRPCKFYPESAFKLIKQYYAFKIKNAEIYDGLLPSKEANVFMQNILVALPNRDQLGRRILIIELGKKWKTNECSLDEVFKGVVLLLEAAILEPQTQVAGAVVIFDMDGLTLPQTFHFTPTFARRIVEWLQDCIPCRVKNLHIVNQPYVFKIVFALFKPFLREKLKSRIIFHGTDWKSLHKYIDQGKLPACYGGLVDCPTVSGKEWLNLLELCDEEYRIINTFGYDRKPQK